MPNQLCKYLHLKCRPSRNCLLARWFSGEMNNWRGNSATPGKSKYVSAARNEVYFSLIVSSFSIHTGTVHALWKIKTLHVT